MIKYNNDFINRVKTEFPEHAQLHWLLDSNSSAVGRILDEATDDRVSETEVIKALTSNKESIGISLLNRCQSILNRRTLYSEWMEIYTSTKDNEVESESEVI